MRKFSYGISLLDVFHSSSNPENNNALFKEEKLLRNNNVMKTFNNSIDGTTEFIVKLKSSKHFDLSNQISKTMQVNLSILIQ